MAKDKNINVNANVKVKGAQAFKGAMTGLATGGVAAMLELATGGSKVKAVWEGIKWTAMAKAGVAGMGAISVSVIGVVQALRTMIKTSGALEIALKRVEDIEMKTTQFEPLVKGAELAKQRVAELVQFAANTPFRLDQIVETSRQLEVLGRGALSGADTLKMVGDAAAVSGRGMEEVGFWVGRFYDGLQSGRPVGEAATRLQEMGLITGSTRARIEEMSQSGADMSVMWQDVQKELKATEGAMVKLSKTTGGLKTTLADTKDAMAAKFGDPFADLEKEKIESTITVLKNVTPAVETIGRDLAVIERIAEGGGLARWFKESITGAEGFTFIVTGLFRGLLGLGVVATVVTGVGLAMWLVGVASAGGVAATSMGLLGKALIFVGVQLKKLLLNPVVALFAAIAALIMVTVGAIANYVDAQKQATEAAKAMAKATSEISKELEKQIKAIESADQKTKAFQKTMQELGKVQAQVVVETARVAEKLNDQAGKTFSMSRFIDIMTGTDNLATLDGLNDRLDMLRDKAKEISRLSEMGLSESEEQKKREKVVRDRERDIQKETFSNQMGEASSQEKLRLIAERRKSLQAEIETGTNINTQKANEASEMDMLKSQAQSANIAFDAGMGVEIEDPTTGKKRTLQAAFQEQVRLLGGEDALNARDRLAGNREGTRQRQIIEELIRGTGLEGTFGATAAEKFERDARVRDARRKSQSDVVQDSQLLADIRAGARDVGETLNADGSVSRTFRFTTDSVEQQKRLEAAGISRISPSSNSFDLTGADIGKIQKNVTLANETAGREEENRKEERSLKREMEKIILARKRGQIELDQEAAILALSSKGMDLIVQEGKIKIDALKKERALIDTTNNSNADQEKAAIDNRIKGIEKSIQLERERAAEVEKVARLDATIASLRAGSADDFIKGDLRGAGDKAARARAQEESEIQRRRLKDLVENQKLSKDAALKIVQEEAAARAEEQKNRSNEFRQEQSDAITGLKLESTPGSRGKSQQFQDLQRFKQLFQEGLSAGLETDEAGRIARSRVNAEISAEVGDPNVVASSLAAIGGGGNIAAGDPMLTASQRQVSLLENIRDVLQNGNPERNGIVLQ